MVTPIAAAMLDQYRARLQRGESLAIQEQRGLVARLAQEGQQATANVDRLVQAREVYDRICNVRGQGVIPMAILTLLIELGRHLGHEGGCG